MRLWDGQHCVTVSCLCFMTDRGVACQHGDRAFSVAADVGETAVINGLVSL